MSETDAQRRHGWVSTRNHSGGQRVYHTDKECSRFPREEFRRRLGTNEVVTRELRECEICATDGGCYEAGGQHRVVCPWCGELAQMRAHLPCDGGDE